MLVSLIIVFREAMEAGLIVGIVLAATEGVPAAAAGSPAASPPGLPAPSLVAAFAAALSDAFEGAGQEIFTAVHPLLRRRHAELAHPVDVAPRPRHGRRNARRSGRRCGWASARSPRWPPSSPSR